MKPTSPRWMPFAIIGSTLMFSLATAGFLLPPGEGGELATDAETGLRDAFVALQAYAYFVGFGATVFVSTVTESRRVICLALVVWLLGVGVMYFMASLWL